MNQMEVRFRSVIDASPMPFALNDDHGNIGYLNPSFTRIFGYDINDISNLAQWWLKAYPDTTYREWIISQWQQRLDKARREAAPFEALEVNIRCKDGSQRIVIAEASPFADAFEMTHLVILYDITESKRSEKRIRQLSSAVEQSPVSIVITDLTGAIEYVNPKFTQADRTVLKLGFAFGMSFR